MAQRLVDKLNSVTRESLTVDPRGPGLQYGGLSDEKFAMANDEVTRLNLFINRLMAK